jgi:hypothetical protein
MEGEEEEDILIHCLQYQSLIHVQFDSSVNCKVMAIRRASRQ